MTGQQLVPIHCSMAAMQGGSNCEQRRRRQQLRAAEEEAATEIATDGNLVVTTKAAEGDAVYIGSVYLLQRKDAIVAERQSHQRLFCEASGVVIEH